MNAKVTKDYESLKQHTIKLEAMNNEDGMPLNDLISEFTAKDKDTHCEEYNNFREVNTNIKQEYKDMENSEYEVLMEIQSL